MDTDLTRPYPSMMWRELFAIVQTADIPCALPSGHWGARKQCHRSREVLVKADEVSFHVTGNGEVAKRN